MDYQAYLLAQIYQARVRATEFFNNQKIQNGWKYTASHDLEKYSGAVLFGSWACILGLKLVKATDHWNSTDKEFAKQSLLRFRHSNGTFYPDDFERTRQTKSLEYLSLHCTNYSLGALLEIESDFNFRSPYLDRFLDADKLSHWLDARSFLRPWEEGNNVVNVASYLALCYLHGANQAADRLQQLLEWHQKNQNPKTGGFDCFESPSRSQQQQSFAGAAHNFHLYHLLKQPLVYERVISVALPYLIPGNLAACFSIDFTELAIFTLSHSPDPQYLVDTLLLHAEALLASQQPDGGWLEAENDKTPTVTHGFRDIKVSSCSYATWFKLCSLGMVAIVLLGDNPDNWGFRKTLGTGYASTNWPQLSKELAVRPPTFSFKVSHFKKNLPSKIRDLAVRLGSKFL